MATATVTAEATAAAATDENKTLPTSSAVIAGTSAICAPIIRGWHMGFAYSNFTTKKEKMIDYDDGQFYLEKKYYEWMWTTSNIPCIIKDCKGLCIQKPLSNDLQKCRNTISICNNGHSYDNKLIKYTKYPTPTSIHEIAQRTENEHLKSDIDEKSYNTWKAKLSRT